MKSNEVIILHDSDGHPYYEAVSLLKYKILYVVSSVFFALFRGIKKRNKRLFGAFYSNFKFRLSVPFLSRKTIIMGMAPYDIRFLFYSMLAFRNNLIFHTSWPFWWSSRVPKKFAFARPILEKVYIWILNNYPIKIVCVTNVVRDSMIEKIHPERCFTIPHSVNTESYSPKNDFKEKIIRLIYVGRLVSEKGVELLLSLAKKLDPQRFELHIVGHGPLASNVKHAADNLAVLTFHGAIHDKKHLAALMGSCHILLLPSRRTPGWEELFGIVVIEAMSCGLVVLATDHIGPASILTHKIDGILLPDGATVEQFHEQIEMLSTDREQLQKISQQARKHALQYDLVEVAKCWKNVINYE